MVAFIRHLLLPHRSNNHRPKLLHTSSLLIISLLLIVTSFGISFFKTNDKSVLGISFNIASQDLLNITNQERQAAGLPSLTLNDELSQAAAGKAEDMMTNNYWAHISPSGVTPWQFITNAGYHYTSAGENLARGFTTSSDVTNAWMASPEHRANVLSKNYQEVGFAVREGSLTGESDTILVVEMFGSRAYTAPVQQVPPVVQQAQAAQVTPRPTNFPTPTCIPRPTCLDAKPQCLIHEPVQGWCTTSPTPIQVITPTSFAQPVMQTNIVKQPLIDSVLLVRLVGTALALLFIVLLLLDLVLVGRKRIVRMVGHNIDHIIFLIAILLIATLLGSGIIL